jgi:TRAP-type C4-dicarboxylate transport system permease large subunit
LVKAAGIDPVYFGVMFIAPAAIGVITPPVGAVLNAVINVSNVAFASAAKGAFLILPVLFPSLVTVPASWFL